MTTGYNIREGSIILAKRRAETERYEQVAAAMLKRARIQRLARRALFLVNLIEGRSKTAAWPR